MPVITLRHQISASAEVCFDLSRSIDVHIRSTAQTGEKAVKGMVAGLIEVHETVTWQAVHFGVKQKLTSVMIEYNRPHLFVDEMVTGAFKRFRHEHQFIATSPQLTTILETFDYTSPLGILGQLVDKLVLKKYMTQLLQERNKVLKEVAESGRWEDFLRIPKRVL